MNTGIITIVLIFTFIFIGILSLLYWFYLVVMFFVHRGQNKPIHQYEITFTGNYNEDFVKLLRNVCNTHIKYYGSDIKVIEFTDTESEVN